MGRVILRLVLLVPLIAVAAGFLWLRSSLPITEGRLTLPGLTAALSITRDAHGIPTIKAENEQDAAFALGFLHAQDRLFQMDMMRRAGAGRLSEWFGTRTVPTDRFLRTLGLYHAAERQYGALPPQLRAVLDAYAAGVNAYLAHRRALPPEYQLLRVTPEPWRPADSLVWGKLMDIELAGNFRSELLHAELAQRFKPEELAILYPAYPKDAPFIVGLAADLLKGLDLDAIHAAIPDLVGPRTASDNWVVDGNHSVSGKPLLANDPHLGFSAPSVWYLARVETLQVKWAGVTSPGGPFVVLGHNAHIAWGFTTTGSDVEDLFIERVDGEDKSRYMTPGGPQPFATRNEVIKVKGADPVTLTVRSTRHGPVVSDLGGDYAAASGTVLALQATWLMDDDRTPEALWGVSRAANWDEFRNALRAFAAPQQNMVYADTAGNIGFIAPAHVPIRAKGEGWVPAPGWSGEYDWTGFIPFDDLPTVFNPESGRIFSANNKIVGDNYPYFLGLGWDIPNRAERIKQLLEETPKQSPESSSAMQADTLSLMAKDLLPLMLQAAPRSPESSAALDLLRGWDGHMRRAEAAPLLFTAWLRELNRSIFADKLGALFERYWGLHPDVIHLVLAEHHEWCDDRSTPDVVETCGDELSQSLERAVTQLRERFGRDPKTWRWGRPHEAQFTSQFWSNVPVLGDLLALHIPADGGYDTLNRGATPIKSSTEPYADTHGATLRMIVDLADIDAARFMIAPGQSGNPLSSHFGDLMEPWRDFAFIAFKAPPSKAVLILAPP